MKSLISIILYIIILQNNLFSQQLWYRLSVPLEAFQTLEGDTSYIGLKNIILDRESNLLELKYMYAVLLFTEKYGMKEKEFLLQNLMSLKDTVKLDRNDLDYSIWYYAFKIDMITRGYLGDNQAIEGMRYLRDNPEDSGSVNLSAILYLAEAGIFEDYQTIMNLTESPNEDLRNNAICLLSYYIKDPAYTQNIKDIFISIIENKENPDYNRLVNCCIDGLASVDTISLIQALEWGFNNYEGKLRLWYFDQLGIYDKDNQPNRSKVALQSETNEDLLLRYIPDYVEIEHNIVSSNYANIEWINFLTNYSQSSQNSKIKKIINYDLRVFKPLQLNNNALEIIISLISESDSVYYYNWLGDLTFKDELKNKLQSAQIHLQNGDSLACARDIKAFQDKVDSEYKDSLNTTPRFVNNEAWKFLYYDAQYILDRLPAITEETGFNIRLVNSSGNLLTDGSLKYYEGSWKDAVDNGDGTFSVNTDRQTVSLRMTYDYGSQTVSNVPAQNNTYTFQTVNTKVQLQNSQGILLIDEGKVKYYAGAWRDFGTTVNGTSTKELLPGNYSFRMSYAYASNDKQQNIGDNPTVVFQTVNANVQLQNSQSQLIDEGTVKYYAGAWRDFGTTLNGVTTKELLPNNYSFRMSYAYASNDKQQNIGDNPTVVFQTVNANVQLQNSQGQLMDEGTVKYYAGAWRDFGTTVNGATAKELLPNNYSFRMTYEYISNDKQQDIGSNNIVDFSTVLCTVKVNDSQNQPVNNAGVKYYAGAWRDFGTTVNGEAVKELLPTNISFRASAGGVTQDKQQDIGTNSLVEINLP